ncbi:hypothetical protein F4777DRAFT_583108 [Nemania sp. FL0916]|nr:hypothetical protein F4777DRAFT_583108 [Nemania sp. FL0916]
MTPPLSILRSNAVLTSPTEAEPYYSVGIKKLGSWCQIWIAATKPLPDPLKPSPLNPKDYLTIYHGQDRCTCRMYSYDEEEFFKTWQQIHLKLRYDRNDNASYAFYPTFHYEVGEALAHAVLVASLAMGKPIPGCYYHMIEKFGAPRLQVAYLKMQRGDSEEYLEDKANDRIIARLLDLYSIGLGDLLQTVLNT